MLISFIFSYLESFFVVFYLSFYFVLAPMAQRARQRALRSLQVIRRALRGRHCLPVHSPSFHLLRLLLSPTPLKKKLFRKALTVWVKKTISPPKSRSFVKPSLPMECSALFVSNKI